MIMVMKGEWRRDATRDNHSERTLRRASPIGEPDHSVWQGYYRFTGNRCLWSRSNGGYSIFYLHALHDQLSFVLIPAKKAVQDYGFTIDSETIELLAIRSFEDVVVFLIVNIIDDVLHVNLKAPILIAPDQRTGCQFVIHQSNFPIRHPLTGKEDN